MDSISTYTPSATTVGSLSITVPEDDEEPLQANTPIILEIVNFAPTSTTNILI